MVTGMSWPFYLLLTITWKTSKSGLRKPTGYTTKPEGDVQSELSSLSLLYSHNGRNDKTDRKFKDWSLAALPYVFLAICVLNSSWMNFKTFGCVPYSLLFSLLSLVKSRSFLL